MKKVNFIATRLFTLNLLFFSVFASAQTPEQAQKITASYDKAYLLDLAAKSIAESTKKKKEAVEYAKARNIPVSYTTKEGSYVELQEILPDGTPLYNTTFNADAARSTRVDHLNIGGSTGYNLDGQNMNAYVWDGGHPRVTHQEYDGPGGNNRFSIMDLAEEGGLDLNFHAAHVAGTIGASGFQPQAKGMAPRSKVKAYKWNDDLGEATIAASQGMLISNHSYGADQETIDDRHFGSYQGTSRAWDNLMFNAPHYLMVVAAGNDGEYTHWNAQPLMPGYDMLSFRQTAKNNLIVAAAHDAAVDANGNLISVAIAGFSNPGPTDDLRIKPDIAGNGVGVYSTYESADDAYASIQGTSMASPNITGSLLLLQEHYNNVNGTFMKAATLKGLALHTADDAGPVGPDAKFGWGLLNAKRAAETIMHNGASSTIQEMELFQGQTITLQFDADGFNDLIASISWTDRAGAINNGLNSPTPALVNDLDIRISKDENTYYPWRLTSPNTNSNSGDNKVDPFERIEVENASGTYTVTISHKGNLIGGSQTFSLIVTGLQADCIAVTTPENVNVIEVGGTTASISWTEIQGALYDLKYRKAGTSTWTTTADFHTSNYEITGLDTFTEYEMQVRSKCPEGTSSAYSATVNFTTVGHNYCESASSASHIMHISNVSLNTINNNSGASTYSDFTNISTDLTAGETYNISLSASADANYYTTYGVWIDYNNNGVFEETERVFDLTTGAFIPATGSFTVPANLDPLTTSMRITMTNSQEIPEPCGVFNYAGEVEDYTIHIQMNGCYATAPQDTNITDINGTTASVSWSPIIDALYDLRYRETGTSIWSDVFDVPSNTYDITGLNYYSEYEVEVRSKCDEGLPSDYSTPVIFSTSGLDYCDSYSSYMPSDLYISNVSLNTINNNSNASVYSDFTNINTELAAGEEYTISINSITTMTMAFTSYAVWIDYNNDGVFDESEKVYSIEGTLNGTATGTFTIPSDVNPSTTTMRISMSAGQSIPEPCDIIPYGEVEDYTINLINVSTPCPEPTDLTLVNVTNNQISVAWTPTGTESSWYLTLGNPGYTPGDDNEIYFINISSPYTQIAGFTSNTSYDLYIRANCDANQSEFVGPLSFTTLSSVINDNVCDALSLTMNESSLGNAYTNIGATAQVNEPLGTCWNGINNPQTVWFSFVAPDSGNVTATTDILGGSLNDTHIAIYEAPTDCSDLLTLGAEVGCDEDGGSIVGYGWTSIATMTGLTPRNTYYIQVDGYNYNSGTFGLEVHDAGYNGFVYENGNWSPEDPSGISTSIDNILVINGTASLTANTDVNNLIIMEEASLKVDNVLTLHGDITNDGELIFTSTDSRNGELAQVPETSSISGNVTVERYMKNKRSYRMVSSAVTTTTSIHDNWQEGAISNTDNPAPGFGTHITGSTTDQLHGFDGTATGNASMFTVNVASQQFQVISNTDENTLTAGEGYLLFVRGDRSIDLSNDFASGETVLRATGSLVTGNVTQSFSNAQYGDFVMFGNPYQSAVNVGSVFNNTESSNLHPVYYHIYDPSIATHGAYVTVNYNNGTNSNVSSFANQYLQPGQAAQTQVSGAASIIFKESNKAPGNFTATNRNPLVESNVLSVQLFTTENFDNEGASHDGFMMFFAEGYDNGLTLEDAIKPLNFYENLGINHNGTYLSIEQRELPQPEEVYALYSSGYQQSEYTLKMNIEGLEEVFLYLNDHFTGATTLLETGDNTYSFNVDNDNPLSIATDRFSIRTAQRLGVDDNSLLSGIKLFPNPLNGDTFYINAPQLNGKQLSISINDLTGRSIYNNSIECQDNIITVPMNESFASGVYLVTLKSGEDAQTYRLIKE